MLMISSVYLIENGTKRGKQQNQFASFLIFFYLHHNKGKMFLLTIFRSKCGTPTAASASSPSPSTPAVSQTSPLPPADLSSSAPLWTARSEPSTCTGDLGAKPERSQNLKETRSKIGWGQREIMPGVKQGCLQLQVPKLQDLHVASTCAVLLPRCRCQWGAGERRSSGFL